MLLHEWLSPDEQSLPTVGEQIRLIEEAKNEKDKKFVLPQEAIDYVLCRGSDYSPLTQPSRRYKILPHLAATLLSWVTIRIVAPFQFSRMNSAITSWVTL